MKDLLKNTGVWLIICVFLIMACAVFVGNSEKHNDNTNTEVTVQHED